MDKDPSNPSTTSFAYDIMSPRWYMMETILGGTETMRAAGLKFLPQHINETDKNYRNRLESTVLLNMVEQTIDTLTGKPFSEPAVLNDDVPEKIKKEILPDVDLQGNNIDVFTRTWFREGFAKAFCHVLVDFPRPNRNEDWLPRTLADDAAEKVRPYWVLIKPENLIFAYAEMENGREVLKQVRLYEQYCELQGFAEVMKCRIRVLEPGKVSLYELRPNKKPEDKDAWALVDEWATGLPVIPLVTFYADRKGFMCGKPPLLDLAWLNIEHWQSSSDQRNILTVTRFPILAGSGMNEEESKDVTVGPNNILYTSDPQGKYYYVEHQGQAISAGQKDLEALEVKMAGYGSEFLKQKPNGQTATARVLDSSEASSDLYSIVLVFEDAVAQVLSYTAQWMKLGEEGGTIRLVKDYEDNEDDQSVLNTLITARQDRDISRKTYLKTLVLKKILPEDFDAELDMEEILAEQDTALARANSQLDILGATQSPAKSSAVDVTGRNNIKGG